MIGKCFRRRHQQLHAAAQFDPAKAALRLAGRVN
jgi:hypothetical protein